MAAHRVARLTIDVTAGDVATGQTLAGRASAAGPMLGEVIARRLDALDDGRRYRLDRLELRLTPCSTAAFETDLADRLDEALAAALPNHLLRAGATNPVMDALDVVTTFGGSGRLPWWTPSGPATLIDAVTMLTTDGDAEAAAHVQFILLRAEPVRRLVRHLPVTTLAAIVAWLTGIQADNLQALVATSGSHSNSEQEIWQTILAVAAASAAPVATRAFTHDVLRRISRGDVAPISARHSEVPRTEAAAVTIPFAVERLASANDAFAGLGHGTDAWFGDAEAGNDAISHSRDRKIAEKAPLLPAGKDILSAQSEIKATPPRTPAAGGDDAHRSDDGAARSQKTLSASDTPPAYGILKPFGSSGPGVADERDPSMRLATKHGARRSVRDRAQPDYASQTQSVFGKIMSSSLEIEPHYPPPSPSQKFGETKSEAAADLSGSSTEPNSSERKSTLGVPGIETSGVGPFSFRSAPGNSPRCARQSVAIGVLSLDVETSPPLRDDVGVRGTSPAFTSVRTERTRPTDARVAAVEHDALQLENAGLLLLWPYIAPYLCAIGLIAAEQLFVSEIAQHRAILLLDHLATDERDAPEYRLPLAKLLAGLPLDAVHAPGPPLDDDEAVAADALLQEILADLACLGHLSIAGLRDAWLRRPGLLTVETGQWIVRVEGRPWDMLLDRLPWPIAQVRLPWMPDAIRVEW